MISNASFNNVPSFKCVSSQHAKDSQIGGRLSFEGFCNSFNKCIMAVHSIAQGIVSNANASGDSLDKTMILRL